MGAGMAGVGIPAATLVDIPAAKKLTRLAATARDTLVLQLILAVRAMSTQLQNEQRCTIWSGLG
ncbi:hypothetical protein OKW34_003498 [Paraburkholderia youngii]